jgi:hypothetical protein
MSRQKRPFRTATVRERFSGAPETANADGTRRVTAPSRSRYGRLRLPWIALASLLGLAACVDLTPPPGPPPAGTETAPTSVPVPTSTAAPTATDVPTGPPHACKLPSPKKSEDACKADADCAPSDPCHAKACVAKAKANPARPDTRCTMNLVCDSVDANRCGCFEGKCALIPPSE